MITTQMVQTKGKEVSDSFAICTDQFHHALDVDAPPQSRHLPSQEHRVTPPPPSQSDSLPADLRADRDYRSLQMELLLFSGDNPKGWVYRARRYFLLSHMTEVHMLELAIIGLERDTLT